MTVMELISCCSSRFIRHFFLDFLKLFFLLKSKLFHASSFQEPRGAHHKWGLERRGSLTPSPSWLNLRMNFSWMNSSTDRNEKNCRTNLTWATSRWKSGFRIAGWRRNGWWCESRLSLLTADLWTWSWLQLTVRPAWIHPVTQSFRKLIKLFFYIHCKSSSDSFWRKGLWETQSSVYDPEVQGCKVHDCHMIDYMYIFSTLPTLVCISTFIGYD